MITKYLNEKIPKVIDNENPPISWNLDTQCSDALIEYAILCYRKRGNEGIKQYSQGSRSGTYEDGLSDSVKNLLPLPFITMISTRYRHDK